MTRDLVVKILQEKEGLEFKFTDAIGAGPSVSPIPDSISIEMSSRALINNRPLNMSTGVADSG